MVEIDTFPPEYGVSDMEILNLVDIFKSQKTYHTEEDIDLSKDMLPEDIKSIKSHVDIDIYPRGYMRYEFHIRLKAHTEAICSVCLSEFGFDINMDEVLELLDKSLEVYSKSHALKEEEFYTYYIDQEKFDPSEIIQDLLLSSIPVKLLCKESCKLEFKKVEQTNKSFAILKELLTKEAKNGGTKT